MKFDPNFIPVLPFSEFKWKWACLQCTEGINDPVVLLGVLFRMRKLEQLKKNLKYSSEEFAEELISLSNDIRGTGIEVDLAGRVGERNIIRNSGQYWSALGLIPVERRGGVIELTDFGRKVADHKISQTEFAAITVRTLTLPNPTNYRSDGALWERAGIKLHPLMLLLQILKKLERIDNQGYLTKDELLTVVIPLSGTKGVEAQDYANYIMAYRNGEIDFSKWPRCCPSANDHRMAREFLLFLDHYGYVDKRNIDGEELFYYNDDIDDEITNLIAMPEGDKLTSLVDKLKNSPILSEMERKRVQQGRSRPYQARFRKAVLGASPRCVISYVTIPEVLEAAHIVPKKYNGEDSVANGFCMRMDIHQLFDSGHLRIKDTGEIFVTDKMRYDYGALPLKIDIPDYINKEFVRWRWNNYNGM